MDVVHVPTNTRVAQALATHDNGSRVAQILAVHNNDTRMAWQYRYSHGTNLGSA